jgi:hypothetical protein
MGHLQPSCSIAFDVGLPSDTFRAPGCSVTEVLGHLQTHALQKKWRRPFRLLVTLM